MQKPKVVIVGGSVGGLKTAEELAKKKIDVLVLEQKPAIGYKVCAGFLSPKALALLKLPNSKLQRKFKSFIVKTLNRTNQVRMPATIATIDRADLHKLMAKRAKTAGAEIRTNAKVTKIQKNHVIVNNKEKIHFDYLVGADGSNSIVRKSLGLKTENILSAFQYITPKKFKNLELIFDFDRFGSAYLWIFPYKDSTSIGTGADLSPKSKKSVREVKLELDKFCKPLFDIKKTRFESALINYDYRGYKFGNRFLIGDAGGFASGLTGEGMIFAMLSGIDVAKLIMNPKYKPVNIKHILLIKRIEEGVLRLATLNKTMARLVFNILMFSTKNKIIRRKLISLID